VASPPPGARSRRKGVTGEAECAALWRDAGWELRGLERSGDYLALSRIHENEYTNDVWRWTLHLEMKRQETLRKAWLDQAKADAPEGVTPVVNWRPNRGEWLAMLPLSDLLELIG
jgi:hypothetical protein